MPAVLSVNPPVVETALRQLEQVHAQMTNYLWSGLTALNSVDVGDWYLTTFGSATTASESADQGRRNLQQALTDVLLADSGLDLSALVSVLGLPIGEVSLDQLLAAFPRAALKDVQKIINKGDDLAMTQHELDLVYDRLSGLNDKDRAFVLTQLTDEENTRLFHNVHDYGFWSNDWSEPKRLDFYDLYQCVPAAEKARIGQLSPIPYLAMLAYAENETANNPAARAALEALRTSDEFRDMSFEERIAALLSEAATPQKGTGPLPLPEATPGTSSAAFDIPVWKGKGVTRIQFFISNDKTCLSGVGPDIACGHGDNRAFVTGTEVTDYEVAARVRVVLNHETGEGTMIVYPTHGIGGTEKPALPVELTYPTGVGLPEDYPSQLRVYRQGEGVDGNIVFDYRLLNGETPELVGGVSPGVVGAIRVQKGPGDEVSIDGSLSQYPSIEIIRDHPSEGEYTSTLIFAKPQESGGPLNLMESPEPFDVTG